MKLTRSLLAVALCFSLSLVTFLTFPLQVTTAQDSKVALQRGYRTGYSDGYMAGYRDTIDGVAKDFSRHGEYSKATRAFNKDYGRVEDYSNGYRQGFESGYLTGFEKRSFESAVPADLERRDETAAIVKPESTVSIPKVTEPLVTAVEPNQSSTVAAVPTAAVSPEPVNTVARSEQPASTGPFQKTGFTPVSDAVIIIPKDTEIIVELAQDLNTEKTTVGDKFTATVVSPTEIAGAVIEGRVAKITKPGHIKRRSEMLLSFNRVILTETRWSNFDAVLTEVIASKGDNVKRIDTEGTAVGQRSFKQDAIKIGAATGTGIVVGAVAGGPVGAGVGAGIGAAFGVGAVIIERGKHIKLNQNQQLRIRTSYETQIR